MVGAFECARSVPCTWAGRTRASCSPRARRALRLFTGAFMSTALLYLVVFAGGVLTILSPCILPVLPFVFARSGRSFRMDTLPMLAGLALSFSLVATAAVLGAGWVASAADAGRWVALFVLAVAGVSLLVPRVAESITRPLVRAGARLQASNASRPAGARLVGALSVGLATGLLWAPCAGPILGLVFAAAITSGQPAQAASLFGVFALGAISSLAVVLLASGRLVTALRRQLAADAWVRRGLGTLALVGVGIIALGLDARFFAGGGLVQTASAEDLLIRTLVPTAPGARGVKPIARPPATPSVPTPDLGAFPGFAGGTGWIGSAPLTAESLRGNVVFVDIWTFECYNCLNALPSVKALHAKYASKGLVVVGVHTPEFPRERVQSNVERAMQKLGVTYPVVTDNGFAIWRAFENRYWPAVYIVDRKGRIRYHWDGEGKYDEQERVVQQLLAEPDAATGSR